MIRPSLTPRPTRPVSKRLQIAIRDISKRREETCRSNIYVLATPTFEAFLIERNSKSLQHKVLTTLGKFEKSLDTMSLVEIPVANPNQYF